MSTIISTANWYMIEDDAQTAQVLVIQTSGGKYQAKLIKDGDETCSSLEHDTDGPAIECAQMFNAVLNKEGYALDTPLSFTS